MQVERRLGPPTELSDIAGPLALPLSLSLSLALPQLAPAKPPASSVASYHARNVADPRHVAVLWMVTPSWMTWMKVAPSAQSICFRDCCRRFVFIFDIYNPESAARGKHVAFVHRGRAMSLLQKVGGRFVVKSPQNTALTGNMYVAACPSLSQVAAYLSQPAKDTHSGELQGQAVRAGVAEEHCRHRHQASPETSLRVRGVPV